MFPEGETKKRAGTQNTKGRKKIDLGRNEREGKKQL